VGWRFLDGGGAPLRCKAKEGKTFTSLQFLRENGPVQGKVGGRGEGEKEKCLCEISEGYGKRESRTDRRNLSKQKQKEEEEKKGGDCCFTRDLFNPLEGKRGEVGQGLLQTGSSGRGGEDRGWGVECKKHKSRSDPVQGGGEWRRGAQEKGTLNHHLTKCS